MISSVFVFDKTITPIGAPSTVLVQCPDNSAIHQALATIPAAATRQQGIDRPARPAPGARSQLRPEARGKAEKEAEQVGAQIGVFSAGAEHGKQAEGRRDRQGPAATRTQAVTGSAPC